jgi:CheY-like chemotaxis protein
MAKENGAQILVVDDDELVRDVTLRRLASLGYRTIAAASGAEALGVLSAGVGVDLLLTDVVMPGEMHGLDLAREARRICPRIKVLFASGCLEESLLDDAAVAGGVDILAKPCTKAELANKVRDVLETC